MLMKEIRDDLNKQIDKPFSWIIRLTMKIPNSSQIDIQI